MRNGLIFFFISTFALLLLNLFTVNIKAEIVGVKELDPPVHLHTVEDQLVLVGEELTAISGNAIDSTGNIFIVDSHNVYTRIIKLDENMNQVDIWNFTVGTGDGELYFPTDMVIDSKDNIYVADSFRYRIQKFNDQGEFVAKWGSSGSGDGQFSGLQGIGIDQSDNIYTTESTNDRVQKFDSSGNYLGKFGSTGSGDGQFAAPSDVSVDASGNIYVLDSSSNRVQKFDSSFSYLTKWGSTGSGDGQFNNARGIIVANSGNIVVSDRLNSRIQEFTNTGTFVAKFGSFGTGIDQFRYPANISEDNDGNLLISDQGNVRLKKISDAFVYIDEYGVPNSADPFEFDKPTDATVDTSGNIYIVDGNESLLLKLGPDYEYLDHWDDSTPAGEFYAESVTSDKLGHVFVLDSYNDRVIKFSTEGEYISQWGSTGSGDGQFEYPYKITTDKNNNVYVAGGFDGRIQKFDNDGNFLMKFGSEGDGDGQFEWAMGIVVNDEGEIYVVDASDSRIQKFDAYGNFITKWGEWGSDSNDPYQMEWVHDLAIDSFGNIYAFATQTAQIRKFTGDGEAILGWGEYGTGVGQFRYSWGITSDELDNIYAIEDDNDRIQVFATYSRITLSESGDATELDEGGSGDTISYRLSLEPSSNVVISLSNPDKNLNFSTKTLIFTPENWQTPQTVTVSAKKDTLVQGDHTGTVKTVITSSDVNYQGMTLGNLTVDITDKTIPKPPVLVIEYIGDVVVSEGELTYFYNNGNDITFQGTSDPLSNIKITVRSDPKICETTADNQGEWNCTYDYIEDGIHTVEIVATSVYGTTTTYPTITLSVNQGLADTGNVLIEAPIIGTILMVFGTIILFVPTSEKSKIVVQ